LTKTKHRYNVYAGVTPFRSMIKYATDKQLPLKLVVFDSNRNEQNILYENEFDEYANTNKNLKIMYRLAGGEGQTAQGSEPPSSSSTTASENDWKGEGGFINKAMLSKYLTTDELDNSIFYSCGPLNHLPSKSCWKMIYISQKKE
jgi:NAD(P)H-flavin reductase